MALHYFPKNNFFNIEELFFGELAAKFLQNVGNLEQLVIFFLELGSNIETGKYNNISVFQLNVQLREDLVNEMETLEKSACWVTQLGGHWLHPCYNRFSDSQVLHTKRLHVFLGVGATQFVQDHLVRERLREREARSCLLPRSYWHHGLTFLAKIAMEYQLMVLCRFFIWV